MDFNQRLDQFHLRENVFTWDSRFKIRNDLSYVSDYKDKVTNLDEFLMEKIESDLDPPQYQYTALQDFLKHENIADLLQQSSPTDQYVALIDDRSDYKDWQAITKNLHVTRNWDIYGQYPPEGFPRKLRLCDAHGLLQLCKADRIADHAERRTIYITNMTRKCCLALISGASRVQAPILRDFLERYLSYRSFIGVSKPQFMGFAMEFHLPYYALRDCGKSPQEDDRGIRRRGSFVTLDKCKTLSQTEYFYETQISVMVTGFDEWYWTAYCCIDTYYDTEDTTGFHYRNGFDALVGGTKRPGYYPVWNPREYFLLILSRRFRQATKEWNVVVTALEKRLKSQEIDVFKNTTAHLAITDDPDLSSTRKYTWNTELLRLLHNTLTKFIESWRTFRDGELQYFRHESHKVLRLTWELYVADIEKDLNVLLSLQRILQQKIEIFDHMKDSLVNASAMAESRVSTDQGKNIGVLTWVTVFYLPLSLATAIYSMTIIPRRANFLGYSLVLICLAAVTMTVAFWARAIKKKGVLIWEEIRKQI